MTLRQDKVSKQIGLLVSEFISAESNRQALITVTRTTISPDFANATVYFTVIPEDKEEEALFFLKRQGREIRAHVAKKVELKKLPYFTFEIDKGEKSRQHIDDLLNES